PTPELRGHRLVHHRHRRRRLVVGACELAPRDERDADRAKESWADLVVFGGGLLIERRVVAVDGDRRRRVAAIAERGRARERGRLDAALRLKTIDQLVLKYLGAGGCVSGG